MQITQFREKIFLLICAIFYLTNFRIYDIMEVRLRRAKEGALKARISLSPGLFVKLLTFKKGLTFEGVSSILLTVRGTETSEKNLKGIDTKWLKSCMTLLKTLARL